MRRLNVRETRLSDCGEYVNDGSEQARRDIELVRDEYRRVLSEAVVLCRKFKGRTVMWSVVTIVAALAEACFFSHSLLAVVYCGSLLIAFVNWRSYRGLRTDPFLGYLIAIHEMLKPMSPEAQVRANEERRLRLQQFEAPGFAPVEGM
jgi:hypothetical protein